MALLKGQYLTLDEGFDVSSRLLSYILNTGAVATFAVGFLVRPLSSRLRDEYLLLWGTLLATFYLVGYALGSHLAMLFASDFVYGASRSKGGVPIIALPSKAKNFSRIVPMLKPGAGVVTTRNHIHYVVTEYGIAELYGKTIRQRAQALINIAHPEFREELTRQAKELHYV